MDSAQFEALIKPTANGKEYERICHEDAERLFDMVGCLTRVERMTKRGCTDYLAGGFIKYVDRNLQYLYVAGVMDKSKQFCYQIPSCIFHVLPKTDKDAELHYWEDVASSL